MLLVVATMVPAIAGHSEVSLTGSNFEIDTDANIKVDDSSPSLDWANVSETRKADSPSGSGDNSFVEGSKEDTPVPTVETGSIPPNKSDLKTFGVYQENSSSGKFLHMFWSRVQDPTGSTNMDFEFNQKTCAGSTTSGCSANGVTPTRTAGDLLITYDLTNGGTVPVLSLRKWTGSKWGSATNLSAGGQATGSINTSSIPSSDSDGLGAHSPRTFGEASINLASVFDPNACQSFGGAYLKSRSSPSFTAAMKDFVPPAAVAIRNCGSIKIIKVDDSSPAKPLAGAEFTLYKDNAPIGGTRGSEDTTTGRKCTTSSTGVCTLTDVFFGEYWVVETVVPAGHSKAADQHVSLTTATEVTLTFVNPRLRGAVLVTKTRKHAASGPGDHPHAGVTFTIKSGSTTVATGTTGSSGKLCLGSLPFGTYSVVETVPAGYANQASKSVTVDNQATCGATTYVGESVSFSNTPLTNITVSVQSQVIGGTNSQIECTGVASTPADTTPSSFDDTSESFKNLEPGTYQCTVVVDP